MPPRPRKSQTSQDTELVEARQEGKAILAHRLFDALLQEAIIDTAVSIHALLDRKRRETRGECGGCWVCGMDCQGHGSSSRSSGAGSRQELVDGTSAQSLQPAVSQESGSATVGASQGNANGAAATATTSKADRYSDNPFLRCIVCNREVGSNRYAMHLAKCCGVNSGTAGGKARRSKVAAGASASSSFSTAAQLARGSKIASALEARKKAGSGGGGGGGLGSGASTPVGGASDSEEGLAPPLGARKSGSNASGKRGSSPSTLGAQLKKSRGIPDGEANGFSRSNSTTYAPSGLGKTPISGSPLNPQNQTGAGSASREGFPVKIPGKRGRPRGSYKGGRGGARNVGATGRGGKAAAVAAKASGQYGGRGGSPRGARGRSSPSASPALSSPRKEGSAAREDGEYRSESAEDLEGSDISGLESKASSLDVPLRSVARGHAGAQGAGGKAPHRGKNKASIGGAGIQRSKGSDGEWIELESASARSDDSDSF